MYIHMYVCGCTYLNIICIELYNRMSGQNLPRLHVSNIHTYGTHVKLSTSKFALTAKAQCWCNRSGWASFVDIGKSSKVS